MPIDHVEVDSVTVVSMCSFELGSERLRLLPPKGKEGCIINFSKIKIKKILFKFWKAILKKTCSEILLRKKDYYSRVLSFGITLCLFLFSIS